MIRSNFKISKPSKVETDKIEEKKVEKQLSKSEFEDFMVKSGASGSFMVFRSDKKDHELGIDEL